MSSMDILRSVAAKHGFGVTDITGPVRSKKLSEARREAVVILRNNGASLGRIAHVLNRGKCTIEYYLNPTKDLERSKKNYAERKGRSVRLDPEIVQMVSEYANDEGVEIKAATNALLRKALEARA